MNNNPEDNAHQDPSETETARLHRLVLPMILDILRARGGNRPNFNDPQDDHSSEYWGDENNNTDQPPALEDDDDDDDEEHEGEGLPLLPPLVDMANSSVNNNDSNTEDQTSLTDQQGQFLPSPATRPPSSLLPPATHTRRPRYRLVVYFEERDLSGTGGSASDDTGETLGQPASDAPSRPSRYVAVFSVDSDEHNMPIIQSAGLQNTPANFDDILNQLFNSYMPKGTPPAKKDIIDSLPTSIYTNGLASQPKCAVCLEEFEEGTETVELPCSHRFHGESCVKAWLRMHNSCPVCRYEMPVDDVEYEQNRKERMAGRTPFDLPADSNTTSG